MWITFKRFSNVFESFVPHFYLHCTHCIISESLLNHPNSFCGGTFKLKAKFHAHLLLSCHFECDGHTVHMFTQLLLLPPLTSTVKWLFFTHAQPSPLSLAARLHQCLTNHSCILTMARILLGQTLYIFQSRNWKNLTFISKPTVFKVMRMRSSSETVYREKVR